MNIVERVKFRWRNNRDPLPGEIEPTEAGATIVFMSQDDEVESLALRKLRGLITGYGEGWTFRAALWDWSWPKCAFVLWLLLVVGSVVWRCLR